MITPHENAVFRTLDDGGVVLNTETGDYFEVNGSARVIWETITGGCTFEELVSALETTYGIERHRARTDVGVFLEELTSRSLVSVEQN